jgi:hypothetical protein
MAIPSHIAYSVIEAKEGIDKKARWLEIGAAWPNADGKGFNITLDAVPVNGRITLRVNEPKPKAG